MRIRIQLFTVRRIRTLLLIKVMRICDHWPTDPQEIHFLSLYSSWILTLTRHQIQIQLFAFMRIRIRLPNMLRLHADPENYRWKDFCFKKSILRTCQATGIQENPPAIQRNLQNTKFLNILHNWGVNHSDLLGQNRIPDPDPLNPTESESNPDPNTVNNGQMN